MAKKPKGTESASLTGEPPHNWKDVWKKAMSRDQEKTIADFMQDSKASSLPWLDKSLFNPEEATKTFARSMEKFSEQTDSSRISGLNLIDIKDFLQSTIAHFQVKSRGTSSSTQILEYEENPAFFLLQQSHALNMKFLKETTRQTVKFNPSISQKLIFYMDHLVQNLSLEEPSFLNFSRLSQNDSRNLSISAQEKLSRETKQEQSQALFKSNIPFQLGKNLGVTPGKIIFQNDLFQLIHYEPLKKRMARRPLLIVPPWTNKYYIFDLNAENSFVRWVLETGLSVFMISWVNPNERDAQATFEDYVLNGLKEALDQICVTTDQNEVNAVGYCTGGTLLACLMVYLKAKKDTRISSATFLATPFDFSKADEWGIYRFANRRNKEKDEEIKYLEEQYVTQALSLLRVNDLIWSSDANHYLLGQRSFPFDMLYWACDGLRLSESMNHTYLRKILTENCLKTHHDLVVGGVPLDLHKLSTPLFIMATQEDHIAPWRSVYPITQMTKALSQKFVLSAAGHITGVFNPPNDHKYHFWTSESLPKSPEEWLKSAKKHKGSWWKEWRRWLKAFEGETVSVRATTSKRALEKSPGSYAMAEEKQE